jgi:major vault protein
MADQVVRLKPLQYIHVHDNNKNVTSLVVGPQTVTLQQHESIVTNPSQYIIVPPSNYVIIENPVLRNAKGELVLNAHGSARVRVGEREIRFAQNPFPLYPEEKVFQPVTPLQTLADNTALLLSANRNFIAENGDKKIAGDEWLFFGPGTYYPRVEVDVKEKRDGIVVTQNQSLLLRAKNKFVDRSGVERQVGEEWLWSQIGGFILGVDEVLVKTLNATVLPWDKGLHVEVLKNYKETRPYAKDLLRKAGQVYLVTSAECEAFTPTPFEKIVNTVSLIKLNRMQYAVVLDPVGPDGVPQLGRRRVVTNCSFFLKPGERLEAGVQDVYVLTADEALLLTAVESYEDTENKCTRTPGDKWLIKGPREYIPNDAVKVVPERNGEKRVSITLTATEGVYVRNTLTGEIRSVIGQTYMLSAEEELWEKELPAVVEGKLAQQGMSFTTWMVESKGNAPKRDRSKVVTYRLPHNTVSQVYDFKKRQQRIIFGPAMIMLGPDEQFTVVSLSGSEWDPSRPNVCLPKKTDRIKALYLFLGPDSMSDVVSVETADHARLALQLCYSWQFDVDLKSPDPSVAGAKCFNVPDFVGDCCSSIASRVRAFVAGETFDSFHKHSSEIVKRAVFGVDSKTGELKPRLYFGSNGLIVTSVDIQEIEVIDEKTRDALQKSVKMAIEITTQSQESTARNHASVREQKAKGLLERQIIEDKAACEKDRMQVLSLTTENDAIESAGHAKAEARSRAESADIEGALRLELAKITAETCKISEHEALEMARLTQEQQLAYTSSKDALDVFFAAEMAEIESQKFQEMMKAVGTDTIRAMATAGPELQARLLAGLGLQGYLISDGTNPINLMNMASGLVTKPSS